MIDPVLIGSCVIWKPSMGGASALGTVVAVDYERQKARIHVLRHSTQTCVAHWVDLANLWEAPGTSVPCSCVPKTAPEGGNGAAA